MQRTDLATPSPVGPTSLVSRFRVSIRLGFCIFGIFVCSSIGIVPSSAQDVADAARQERARKESQHKKPKHIYTEEDLKRAQILTPEDRAELEAKRNEQLPSDTDKTEEALDNLPLGTDVSASGLAPENSLNPLPPDAPLGDVARYYRRWKISQALRHEQQFPLAIPKAPVLASPKPMEPLRGPIPLSEPVAPRFDSTQRLLQPTRPSRPVLNPAPPEFVPFQPPVKRSPFARPKFFTAEPPRVSSSRPAPPSLAPEPPAKPTKPVALGRPSRPLITATPSKPMAHVNPPAIVAPLDATKPLDSANPVAPVQPSKPFVAGNPSKPFLPPSKSAEPIAPVNPPAIAWTLNPAKPLASATPVAPVQPSKPFVAGNPSKPVAPSKSAEPAAPVNPPVLVAPLRPAEPLASATPSAPVAPVMPSKSTAPMATLKPLVVTVKHGDSLWKLAEEHLGQGLRWHELLVANPNIHDANHIEAGSQIFLPAAVSSSRTAATMTVQKGDSLSKIARAIFGHGSSWSCIARSNPSIKDANRIYTGQTLSLPTSCKR